MATQRFKYRAINMKGRPVTGVLTANDEVDLHNQLQSAGLELVQAAPLHQKKSVLAQMSAGKKIKVRDLIQLLMHIDQMQSAGVPLLDTLADLRDTTEHDRLRDIMAEVYRDVSEGSSLSEAMAMHPKVFSDLYISLISSGEETGDMGSAYRQLIKYLQWLDDMQVKVRKATRYPMVVTAVVILTISIVMGLVVPQVVGFIEDTMKSEIPFYTKALIVTSEFFVKYWLYVLITPILLVVLYKGLRIASDEAAYQFDRMFLRMPLFGNLIRKINIARFAQTFGAMFSSGIPVLKSLEAARRTVTNLALIEALEGVQEQVKAGSPLSEAFNASGEFPSMVVRMLKVGEESGNLTKTLDQVSEFYTRDVDEAVQGLISMIEPLLTAVLGGTIMWIAVAVFGPIYAKLGEFTEGM